MAHSFSKQLTAGTPENVNDVMTDLNEAATDWEFAFSTWKTMQERTVAAATLAAGTYVMPIATGDLVAVAGTATAFPAFEFNPADYTAATRTTKMRVRAWLVTNAVAPATTWTVGLYPVTAFGGASGATPTVSTLGTVTSGSTVAFTTPGASNGGARNQSTSFTAPTSGFYVLGVVNSGSQAANSSLIVRAQLQVQQT